MTKAEFIQQLCVSLAPMAIEVKLHPEIQQDYGTKEISQDAFIFADILENMAKERGMSNFFESEYVKKPIYSEYDTIPVHALELSDKGSKTKLLKACSIYEIGSLGDLLRLGSHGVSQMRNIGKKITDLVSEQLKKQYDIDW